MDVTIMARSLKWVEFIGTNLKDSNFKNAVFQNKVFDPVNTTFIFTDLHF